MLFYLLLSPSCDQMRSEKGIERLFPYFAHLLSYWPVVDRCHTDDLKLFEALITIEPLHKFTQMSTDRCVSSVSRARGYGGEYGVDVMQAGSLLQFMDTIHPGKQIHVLLYYTCARFHLPFNPVINDLA